MIHFCFCTEVVKKKIVDNDVGRLAEYFQEVLNCLEREKKLGLMIAEAMGSILIE